MDCDRDPDKSYPALINQPVLSISSANDGKGKGHLLPDRNPRLH